MGINEVVIVSACRTPIARFMGSLKDFTGKELAIIAAKEAVNRAGISPDQIDEIVLGQIYPHLQGSLPPVRWPCSWIANTQQRLQCHQNCASGMRALEIICDHIALGKIE